MLVRFFFQSVIFHQMNHPQYPSFQQCVTFGFFPSDTHEMVYQVFNVSAVYLIPLVVIVVSYSLILIEITKRSKDGKGKTRVIVCRKYRIKRLSRGESDVNLT